jgi:hypothetical protein
MRSRLGGAGCHGPLLLSLPGGTSMDLLSTRRLRYNKRPPESFPVDAPHPSHTPTGCQARELTHQRCPRNGFVASPPFDGGAQGVTRLMQIRTCGPRSGRRPGCWTSFANSPAGQAGTPGAPSRRWCTDRRNGRGGPKTESTARTSSRFAWCVPRWTALPAGAWHVHARGGGGLRPRGRARPRTAGGGQAPADLRPPPSIASSLRTASGYR